MNVRPIFLAAAGAVMAAAAATPAFADWDRGHYRGYDGPRYERHEGGFRGQLYYGRPHYYNQPYYSQPYYSQPYYNQPYYASPAYNQPYYYSSPAPVYVVPRW